MSMIGAPEDNQAQVSELFTRLRDDLDTLDAILAETNATINANPAARVKDMARIQRRIIKYVTTEMASPIGL